LKFDNVFEGFLITRFYELCIFKAFASGQFFLKIFFRECRAPPVGGGCGYPAPPNVGRTLDVKYGKAEAILRLFRHIVDNPEKYPLHFRTVSKHRKCLVKSLQVLKQQERNGWLV
jgi:hypothetical protein